METPEVLGMAKAQLQTPPWSRNGPDFRKQGPVGDFLMTNQACAPGKCTLQNHVYKETGHTGVGVPSGPECCRASNLSSSQGPAERTGPRMQQRATFEWRPVEGTRFQELQAKKFVCLYRPWSTEDQVLTRPLLASPDSTPSIFFFLAPNGRVQNANRTV